MYAQNLRQIQWAFGSWDDSIHVLTSDVNGAKLVLAASPRSSADNTNGGDGALGRGEDIFRVDFPLGGGPVGRFFEWKGEVALDGSGTRHFRYTPWSNSTCTLGMTLCIRRQMNQLRARLISRWRPRLMIRIIICPFRCFGRQSCTTSVFIRRHRILPFARANIFLLRRSCGCCEPCSICRIFLCFFCCRVDNLIPWRRCTCNYIHGCLC